MGKVKLSIDNIESVREDQQVVLSPVSKLTLKKAGLLLEDVVPKSEKFIKNLVKSNDQEVISMYKEHFDKKR